MLLVSGELLTAAAAAGAVLPAGDAHDAAADE
jgi:hypothetical protein